MNRYQLATLVEWAGELKTRKRLQKVVYLLQAGGCDLGLDYSLHHYGPYSQDLASLTDGMVHSGLLREDPKSNAVAGTSYQYALSETATKQLRRMGEQSSHQARLGALAGHRELAERLLAESDVRQLEYAATVAYFFSKQPSAGWDRARQAAARFKKQDAAGLAMRDAEKLAREVIDGG